jgi:hypothetical protein
MMIVYEKQITPYIFCSQDVKGQGHINLVDKNGFQTITKERLSLGLSDLIR